MFATRQELPTREDCAALCVKTVPSNHSVCHRRNEVRKDGHWKTEQAREPEALPLRFCIRTKGFRRTSIELFFFPRPQLEAGEPWVPVEFLAERCVVALLPFEALGAVEGSPIHLLLVSMGSFAHFRENSIAKRA